MAEWKAKPSGGYYYGSGDGLENVKCINGFFNSQGYSLEVQAGIICNIYHESALNPWRWQYDIYNQAYGYGLFQFTPGSDYLNYCNDVMGFAPNLSVTEVTAGAAPWDGYAQLIVMHEDRLSKWTPYCWRTYWNDEPNADALRQVRDNILNTYGSGGLLTYQQFLTIDRVDYAVFAFLACYEGPLHPNYYTRLEDANQIYAILSGTEPPVPPGPEPGPTPGKKKSKVMFYLKPYWKRGF